MGTDTDAHAEAIRRQGYTVIEGFLSADVLAQVRSSLAPYLGSHQGRNRFEGNATERIYTLVARARVFWSIVLDARILALCDCFLLPNYLLTASQAIDIGPGELAQPLHYDDSFHRLPRPRAMVSLSTIVAVDAFTLDNGEGAGAGLREPRGRPGARGGGALARVVRAANPQVRTGKFACFPAAEVNAA